MSLEEPLPQGDDERQTRWQRWTRRIGQFLFGQIALQIVTILPGILLIHWMTKMEYAKYSVAFMFQSILASLVDLNFSAAIPALVGTRVGNPDVVGQYLRAARHHRNRMMAIMGIGSTLAFPMVTRNQHWGFDTKLLLLLGILGYVFCQGGMLYGVPLRITGKIRAYYQPLILSGLVRIALCFIFWRMHGLTGPIVTWITTVTMGMTALLLLREARGIFRWPTETNVATEREMLYYLAPSLPNIVFVILQGQIAIALITVFGKTQGIAEVAAMGRISQVFNLLNAFSLIIIQPYFARLEREALLRRYLQVVLGTVVVAGSLLTVAYLFPQVYLWILGAEYSGLEKEIVVVILGGCINYISTTMWVMSNVRKWVYWWPTFLNIGVTFSLQIIFFMHWDLSKVMNVVWFQVVNYAVMLAVQILIAGNGFLRGVPRRLANYSSE